MLLITIEYVRLALSGASSSSSEACAGVSSSACPGRRRQRALEKQRSPRAYHNVVLCVRDVVGLELVGECGEHGG